MRPSRTTTHRRVQALAAAFGALLLIAAPALAAPNFPALTGRVVDQAGILSPATRDRLTQMLAQQERATGNQVVVVTLKSLQGYSIEEFGYRLGRYLGIGQKNKDNGVLLIVAPNERKVRIEVGYGLEGTLTDAESRIIIERDILPAFRHGDFNAGVLAGVTSILKVLGGGAAQSGLQWNRSRSGSLSDPMLWIGLLLIGAEGFLFLMLFFVGPRYHPARKKYVLFRPGRSSRDPLGLAFLAGYSGGHFGGGGGFTGGGGFSGGGGSFGGGGASGSW